MIRLNTLSAVVALAASTLVAAPAIAGEFDAEQARQQDRIARGISSGQLTRSEVRQLETEQDRIANMISRAKRDGRIDPYERAEITRAQAAASSHIRAEKHDPEVQPRRRWGWWHRASEDGPRRWWH
jgi:uncharacterized membrane protein YebE (DUF533 family)